MLPPADYAADESCAPRGYLAATMQFVPGHFSCDVVWGTVIRVHSRLKMGPSMGVSRGMSLACEGSGSGRCGEEPFSPCVTFSSNPGPALCAQRLLCSEPEKYVCLSRASHKGCVLPSVCGP